MVKIPGLDDLRKMGTDLMDTAKSSKLGGAVADKLNSVTSTKVSAAGLTDEALKNVFQSLQAALTELNQAQTMQADAARKIQTQAADLIRMLEAQQSQKVAAGTVVEEKKSDGTET